MSIKNAASALEMRLYHARAAGKEEQRTDDTCPICHTKVKHVCKHLKRYHDIEDAKERKDLMDRLRARKLNGGGANVEEDCLATLEESEDDTDTELTKEVTRYINDPLLNAYVRSQAGWSEDVETHWANKRARLLSRVLSQCAEPDSKSCLDALTDPVVLDRLEVDLKQTCKEQPALCKSKVIAIVQFCRFLHGRVPEARDALTSSISRAEEWKVKASKEDRKRAAKIQGRMSDDTYLPSKEELQEYRNKVDAELQRFTRGECKTNYTNAVKLRRILEAKICISDFNRAGPLTNALLSEYDKMERLSDGGGVLNVERHKSAATHGPASLPLSKDIVQGLDLFVSEYRPKLHSKTRTMLFPSAKPDVDIKMLALDSGMIELSKKLSPALLRKVAGTAARSVLPEADCEKLANLMCHQPDTQRRHYAAKQLKSSNIAVAALIEQHLFGPLDHDDEPSKGQPDQVNEEQINAATGNPGTSSGGRREQLNDKKRRPFTEEEKQALLKVSGEFTDSLTVSQVISLTARYPALKNRSTKVLCNKLREIAENEKKTRNWVVSGHYKLHQ